MQSLVQSSLCVMQQGSSNKSDKYLKLYFILKGQKTLLSRVAYLINAKSAEIKEQANNGSNSTLRRLKDMNESLCNCTFGDLLSTSLAIVQNIHSILLEQKLSPDIEKLATKQLNTTVQITKTLSSFVIEMNRKKNSSQAPLSSSIVTYPENKNLMKSSLREGDNDETVVCRICDEHVPVELLEEHTTSCMSAYQSETKLSEIAQTMSSLRTCLCATYLNCPWPNTQKNALGQIIPLVHFFLILHRAIQTDPHGADAPEELDTMVTEIQSISEIMDSTCITMEGLKIKKAIKEKKHASLAIRQASEILRKTRISGSDQTISHVTIADFDIIKRISSGAYARVFLVKKKKTGDIYALKVLPKNDVCQKNQVKRVLAEKDILLQFNNPYIINFCM